MSVPHEPIMQYFRVVPQATAELRRIWEPFAQLAHAIEKLPRNAERTVALRKLLESRDAAVRAATTPPDRDKQTITAAHVGSVDDVLKSP